MFLSLITLRLEVEIRRRCVESSETPPSRNTVARRWAAHREAEGLAHPIKLAPGNFVVKNPMDVVQVDHTQADVLVVDTLSRRPIGRPWLSLAIDVATRCVVGFYVGMDRPGAATVALLLTRVALPKSAWLDKLGMQVEWPMRGVPKVLHLDNAAEFKSRALRTGCSEYGIELMYRPVGRLHFGGHIERLNRTLMERVHGLPGSTGSSPKGRKARAPEKGAALRLHEFEQWSALEIGQRYHNSAHRAALCDTSQHVDCAGRRCRGIGPARNAGSAVAIPTAVSSRRPTDDPGRRAHPVPYPLLASGVFHMAPGPANGVGALPSRRPFPGVR